MKIQVYLDGVTGERLAARAKGERRSVSSMAALLLEEALAGHSFVIGQDVARVVPPKPRVPPETPPAEPRAAVVEKLQQQVPGVQTGAAFPARSNDLAGGSAPRPRGGGR